MRVLLVFFLLFASMPLQAVNLFDEFSYRPFASDRVAQKKGDILTVLVMENANAEASTDLASSKSISTEIEASYKAKQTSVGFGLAGKGKSAAKTGRNGKIKAALTVSVKDILSEGLYLVMGTQSILINGEQQLIVLTGTVRREDISPQNTVLSTRVADAKITYNGVGSVSNSQHRNYIYKAFSFLGLV